MNLKIRNNIIDNIKDENTDNLLTIINESVNKDDEIALPGMGVILEIVWNNSDDKLKKQIVEQLKKGLN